jgi:hypothetical protein
MPCKPVIQLPSNEHPHKFLFQICSRSIVKSLQIMLTTMEAKVITMLDVHDPLIR